MPSYSSKALAKIPISTTIDKTAEFIAGSVLISAYDIRHHAVDPNLFKAQLLIVDSGGYEKLVDEEGKRRGGNADHASFPWSSDLHAKTLATIDVTIPVVAVSYDRTELAIGDQIAAALAARDPRLGSAFLLKPKDGEALAIESITEHATMLRHFDIVGVTEKEAGGSFFERLIFIARLRALLDSNEIDKPVHVFGGLDPFMTLLYFLAGADIVDGLTWLRMAFTDNDARYLPEHAAMSDPMTMLTDTEWQIRRNNFGHMIDMQTAIRRFLRSGDYNVLSRDWKLSAEIKKLHGRFLQFLTDRISLPL
ncbi:MAG: hypothetical protein P4M05_25590 [Bradyrhizobium sp.]|nr:hypothetical protein [Bradyrhizobium sp.]